MLLCMWILQLLLTVDFNYPYSGAYSVSMYPDLPTFSVEKAIWTDWEFFREFRAEEYEIVRKKAQEVLDNLIFGHPYGTPHSWRLIWVQDGARIKPPEWLIKKVDELAKQKIQNDCLPRKNIVTKTRGKQARKGRPRKIVSPQPL